MSKPDNTQELDYTHPDEMPTVEHRPCPSSDLRGMIVHFTSEMLDDPNDYGIYPTTNFYSDLKEAILDWHNKQVKNAVATAEDKLDQYWNKELDKQIEELLDRLEAHWTPALVPDGEHPDGKSESEVVPLSAIQAERAKLKEVK